MKSRDYDRERSEKRLSLAEFLAAYNEDLPSQFPRVSLPYLKEFRKTYTGLFKSETWSLDQHRKKVMDWLPAHLKALEPRSSD